MLEVLKNLWDEGGTLPLLHVAVGWVQNWRHLTKVLLDKVSLIYANPPSTYENMIRQWYKDQVNNIEK